MLDYKKLAYSPYVDSVYSILSEYFGVSFIEFLEILNVSYRLSESSKSKFEMKPFSIVFKKHPSIGTTHWYCLFPGMFIVFYEDKEGQLSGFKTTRLSEDFYKTMKANEEKEGELAWQN